jgi:predicted dienelactone hydrolase
MATAPAAAAADSAPVGHRVENLVVPGSFCERTPADASCTARVDPTPQDGEDRRVRVHLWYPAEEAAFAAAPKSQYTSELHGKQTGLSDPLGWSVEAEIARETGAVKPGGAPFPVLVFSHGAANDPIDYAWTMELIAAAGFVVAAPYHTNNTQDDVRIGFFNNQTAPLTPLPCNDGRPSPCARNDPMPRNPQPPTLEPAGAHSVVDRVRDITQIINALDGWFGGRADVTRVGVIGHSRGTITALAAAGGSTAWQFGPEPRVKAIMGLANGGADLRNRINLTNVTVPALFVAGGGDLVSPVLLSEQTVGTSGIASADKQLVVIQDATHRQYQSSYCAMFQSAGALAQANPRAILDFDTARFIANSPPGGAAGKAVHFCANEFFTTPVNLASLITQLASVAPGSEYICAPGDPDDCHTVPSISGPATACKPAITTPPCIGLDTEAVKHQIRDLAVEFFNTRLAVDRDGDGVPDAADNCPTAANGDQADSDTDGTGDACDPTPYGTTPPELTVPADFAADATGPAGATVTFAATAADDLDPNPTVTCTPASGSVFAIGPTAVACVATDHGGNASEAKAFTVTVRGAGAQISDLIADVVGATGLPASVRTQLTAALQSLLAGFDPARPLHRAAACLSLRTFTVVVRFLAPAHAAGWIEDANRIRAVLAC